MAVAPLLTGAHPGRGAQHRPSCPYRRYTLETVKHHLNLVWADLSGAQCGSTAGKTTAGKTTGGGGAVDARLSPDGQKLYLDGSKIGAVAAFAVNGGNLTELANSPTPLPAGATAAGIVVT